MMGRRTAALLCVLLMHALGLLLLVNLHRPPEREREGDEPEVAPITLFLEPAPESAAPDVATRAPAISRPKRAEASMRAPAASAPAAAGAGESAAITPTDRVDWPLEGQKAAQREVERAMEAERIARMFAGPKGTWASLTKRQRAELNKFRWKRGVEGLKFDEHGNAIYELPNGCAIVNLMFFGCPIGAKPAVHGDMFDNMREYFDEQRLPETKDGNGTEPEALRPPR